MWSSWLRSNSVKFLKQLLREMTRPGAIYIIVVEPVSMTKFTLKAALPPTVDADVASREFTYKINDDSPVITPLAKDATEFTFNAPLNASVLVTLVDIDGAGNRSEPSTRGFTVTDTVPPHQPGEIGITTTGQVEE